MQMGNIRSEKDPTTRERGERYAYSGGLSLQGELMFKEAVGGANRGNEASKASQEKRNHSKRDL